MQSRFFGLGGVILLHRNAVAHHADKNLIRVLSTTKSVRHPEQKQVLDTAKRSLLVRQYTINPAKKIAQIAAPA